MADFLSSFNKLAPFTNEVAEDLQKNLQTKSFDKGELLLKSGSICRKLFFIDKGLVKTFFFNEDKEFIMRFFPEYTFFTVLDSFTNQTPSGYDIMALEKTSVTFILQTELELLCKKHHSIETAFRKLLSFAVTNMMKRISEMLEENATERYNHFLKDNGHLIQRVSLGDLANYLGITQVSLSRIRANK
ncbi:MAG TPA: Crp/Fnr family transcriptional regulator [Niabella sp.]|nr:Crp/Fnr family transcriptional regulator [Niabella sp.]HQX21558.1 Crp/Fnr family transcriptional regulator [Niabella sp.]HRB37178.1 Crp/Fnr family transcriptional regulator [Niabella sp.]HRB41988.1 Crp/Fnr family transcriptional regulator [Niabella sp.]HRB47959.1 Crp/Fnr family transcriptional regulator [Niabella sp.]